LDVDVTDWFQITSGKEVHFPKTFQEIVEPVILGNPSSYFTATVLGIEPAEHDAPSISTTGSATVAVRVGQAKFRQALIDYWGCCSVIAISELEIAYILKHTKAHRIKKEG